MKKPIPMLKDLNSPDLDAYADSVRIMGLMGGPILTLNGLVNQDKLTLQNITLLQFLSRDPQVTMTGISRKWKFSTAAATGALDTLEARGFATRVDAPGDRRKNIAIITPAGRQYLNTLRDRLAQALTEEANEQSKQVANERVA